MQINQDNFTLLVAEYTTRAGTETFLLQLLNLFSENSKSVFLVTIGGQPNDKVSMLAKSIAIQHLRIGDSIEFSLGNKKFRESVIDQIIRELPQTSIGKVIVSVGTPGAFTECLKLSQSSFYILHSYPHGKKQKLFGRIFARNFPQNTTVLCVSEYSKNQLMKYWGKRLEVCVVPNGVPSQKNRPEKDSSTVQVLTVGSVETYKNPELWFRIALRYLKSAPDSKAKFIWVGEGSQLGRIRKQIPDDYRDQIIFAGSVDDPSRYFRKATVYLQPSKIESFGLAVAEALSFGIPCVVADTGGLPEVVSEKCSILVAPDDVSGYVSALSELLGNKKLLKRMSLEASNRHTEMLSIESWQTRMTQTLQLQ